MTETDILSNQTTFFEEEVLDSTPPSLPIEEDPHKAEKEQAKKKQLRLFILLGTVGTTIMAVGLALVVLFSPEPLPVLTATPSPISIANQKENQEILERLTEVEADIRSADPVNVGFPYPPINANLFLD